MREFRDPGLYKGGSAGRRFKNQPAEREHAWVARSNPYPDWEERDCPVCGLQDKRYIGEETLFERRREWGVKIPCIEQPPEKVTFQELTTELEQHGEKQPRLSPYAMGNPNRWTIGLFRSGARGLTQLRPAIILTPDQTLEHGWAQLLRWIRVRQYQPSKFEHYESTGLRTQTICAGYCDHGDDD